MKAGRIAVSLVCSLAGALVIAGVSASPARAQHHESWGHQDRDKTGAFVKQVREATARFRNPAVAIAEGYKPAFGCVSGGEYGAMGMHYVNFPLVLDGVLDPERPEIVIYEPTPGGRPRLIGADFLIFKEAWDTQHPEGPPTLGGQLLHLFESPNRFGLNDFYTLHVWAWKENPTGMFVNWHADVKCEAFSG